MSITPLPTGGDWIPVGLAMPSEGMKCEVVSNSWPFGMGLTEVLWITLPREPEPWWYSTKPDGKTLELHYLHWKPTHWRPKP